MQLTLPSRIEPVGKLVLEQGARAGRCYRFEASICKNPVCRCEHITLHFLADGAGTGQANAAKRPVLASLELDLAKPVVPTRHELGNASGAKTQAGAQWAVPVWQRQEIQTLLRGRYPPKLMVLRHFPPANWRSAGLIEGEKG
jgi:hypothetical protein